MGFPDGYNCDLVLGEDNANNSMSTSSVTANKDGSVLERLEYLQKKSNNLATKVLTTIANGNTTLFTYSGTVRIKNIVGRITTVMETKTQNTKLSVVSDSLTAVDICANVDLTAGAVGTMLTITGTTANAMIASVNGAIAPGQANGVVATCTTSGIIRLVSGAANTGAITWMIEWEPISEGATLV